MKLTAAVAATCLLTASGLARTEAEPAEGTATAESVSARPSPEDTSAADPDAVRAAAAASAARSDAEEPTVFVINDHLQLNTNSSPSLILHQNLGVYPEYQWKISGNEEALTVTDNQGGIPLLIRPGAPSSSIEVTAPSGNVGMGITPSYPLHVWRTNGTARLLVEEASPTVAEHVLFHLKNKGKTRFLIENTDGGHLWTFDNNGALGFSISKVGTGVNELLLGPTGDLTIQGVLTQLSDRNVKRNLRQVDGTAVLERLVALPVSTWSYAADAAGARHMGPMAQDFKAAFGLGTDDTHVAPSDVAGVGLAAVQALKRQLDENEAEQRARLAEKDAQIRDLSDRLAALEARSAAVGPE